MGIVVLARECRSLEMIYDSRNSVLWYDYIFILSSRRKWRLAMFKATRFLVGGMFMLTACSANFNGSSNTPTPNQEETTVALSVQQTKSANEVVETEAAEKAQSLLTATAIQDQKLTLVASIDANRRAGPETATAEAAATNPILELLVSGGYINSTNGVFSKLDDFDETYTKRDWFWRFPTGQSPTNFVLRAILTLDSEEDNRSTIAGCGFSFRKTNTTTGNYILLDFLGNLRFGIIDPDYWIPQGLKRNIVANPSNSFEIWLVVEEGNYYVFLDGVEVFTQRAVPDEGFVTYMIAAGSVPMRCTYQDVWVWDLTN